LNEAVPLEPEMRRAGEFDLIAELRRMAGPSADARHLVGIGDDAAVTLPGGATATSIDALVDGVHFRSAWCPPRAVGHKAMATALSDLAAMGAEPGEAYVWLGRPHGLDDAGCLELAEGLIDVARRHGAALLGGDLTMAPALSVCVTAVGHAARAEDLVGRAGAGAGDVLCVTGELGSAAAGLALLEDPGLAGRVGEAADAAVARQLEPEPRSLAGPALARAGASALIDVSDGLGADAAQLAAASGVEITIELERVPVGPGVAEVAAAGSIERVELLGGGEDYELLCALPPAAVEAARAAVRQTGTELTEIGAVGAGSGVVIRDAEGGSYPLGGHDHRAR
jgi:thiamine-monophosphate kinase